MRRLLLLLAGLSLPATVTLAQTNPAPFDFATTTGVYQLAAWDPATAAGTFPPNMAFHRFAISAPSAQDTAAGDWSCPYNLTARPRIQGKNAQGFSFLNTSSAQYDNCTSGANTLATFVGEAVLALNTMNAASVTVNWLGRMHANLTYVVGNQERVYAIGLQYRVGHGGAFTALPNQLFAATTLANDTVYRPQGDSLAFSAPLPAAALNQPEVQLRWVYHNLGGSTGSRPELGVDNITASAVLQPSSAATLPDIKRLALTAAPNPLQVGAAAVLHLTASASLTEAVQLFDATGRLVATLHSGVLPAGSHALPIPAHLTAGVYYLRAAATSTRLLLTN